MEFSLQQKQAINTRDVNILVQAAAGSGKTRVLVEKIIRLVCGVEEKSDGSFEKYSKISYIIRDQWMVNNSNLVIAVYHGVPGGTEQTLAYAKKTGKDILYCR